MAKKHKGPRKQTPAEEFELPQGLEVLEGNGWKNKILGWIKNNFSAVILPIIALLILGGGIYLYSQQRGGNLEINEEDLTTGVTVNLEEEEAVPQQPAAEEDKEEQEAVMPEEEQVTEEETEQEPAVIGGPEQEAQQEAVYRFAAEKGEGITHLARKALRQYLSSKGKDLNLTPEHKIFIEDYMQNRIGDRLLKLGEVVGFSESLIQEAIAEAQQLTDAQLQNLTQYAQLVPSLNY